MLSGLALGMRTCAGGFVMRTGEPTREVASAADAETTDQSAIARLVVTLDIVKQRTTLRDELQKTAAGMVVLRMGLEMLGQIGDPLGENGDLDIRGAGITFFRAEFLDQFLLALRRDRYRFSFR